MSNGGRKDKPKSSLPQAEPSASDDGLLTSEDLFGDMVDEPAAPAAPPATPRTTQPSRKGPIRVQVSEPGAEGKSARAGPAAGEVLPEDVAALLDAFSGPAEDAARTADAAKLPALPPAPPPQAAPPAAPLEEVFIEDLEPLGDLAALVEAPAPKPAPAQPPRAVAPPPRPAAVAPPAPPPARAAAAPPSPEPLPGLRDLPLGETTPAPPWRPGSREAAKAPPSPAATVPGLSLDSLLDLPELQGAVRRAEPAPAPELKPASRTGTKFQAQRPEEGPVVEERMALDLAALAEEAMASSAPRQAEAPPPLPEQSYGPYRLLEKVAVGGMAEVFKAKRSGVEGFEKVVAVKRILAHLSDNKEFVDMFIDEAKMVAGLTHPNIVQIFDLGKIEKSYYIAMEYVHGRDLRSIVKRAKDRGIRIPLDLSVLIVGKVCAALEYAHRAKDDRGRAMKIVHRDISPQNILISFEGDVKLTDFGIAKAATKASTTERGALRGKLLYMSPEQAWGKSMDRRSDIFSLGIVFYEMTTDQKPFLASSEMSILEMVRDCRIAPPTTLNPRIPEKLESVVMKALARDAEQRYQDAGEMSRDLERALQERKVPTAAELAKFMEVLFDPTERGTEHHDEHTSGVHRPGTGEHLEVEFESTPAQPTPTRKEPATPAAKDANMSIDKLLKRFGIK